MEQNSNTEIVIHNASHLKDKIYTIRGVQVMLDSDLAEIYGYSTKAFNQQVKNNIDRFDDDFRFQLTEDEAHYLRSKFLTANISTMSRSLPYAFTEQGVYMLMTVLKGELAITQSKMLIRLFNDMKNFLQTNARVFAEIDIIKKHLLESDIQHKEHEKQIAELFTLMDKYKVDNPQGVFFQGQIFDAYAKFQSIIAQAQSDIVLIDNYVDVSVLERLSAKKSGVSVTIYTSPQTKLTKRDIKTFNTQYPTLKLKTTDKMHDRFLILDNAILYHIGASLKDLGKKCFAFDLFDASFIPDILAKL